MESNASQDVLEVLRRGESQEVEFKTRLPTDSILARDLVGLANSSGGILLVGVGDRGEPIGLSDDEAGLTMARLHQLTSSLFPWPTQIGTTEVYGKVVVYALVQKAPPHLYPITTSSGEIYSRRGTATVRDEVESPPQTSTSTANTELSLFVAMSFHYEQEPSLVDYFRAIMRAADRCGYQLRIVRMDLVEGDYEISQGVMDQIDACDIILSDFTLSPPNVYFELGYSRGGGQKDIANCAPRNCP